MASCDLAEPHGPVEPVRASTVILVREGDGKPLVYLLRRSGRSDFLPDTYVFPGGTLEAQDWDPGLVEGHVDLSCEMASLRLGNGISLEESLAHAVAAVRETFEEAGVLLARREGQRDHDLEEMLARRGSPKDRESWFTQAVIASGWILEISRLARWGHWITPALLDKRFDTRFFMATLPEGQRCAPDHSETTHGIWLSPWEALGRNHRGELALSPPTLVNLHEVLSHHTFADLMRALANRPWGEGRTPRAIPREKGALLLLPWDPLYDAESPPERAREAAKILEPGEPFSRLWLSSGIWRPSR